MNVKVSSTANQAGSMVAAITSRGAAMAPGALHDSRAIRHFHAVTKDLSKPQGSLESGFSRLLQMRGIKQKSSEEGKALFIRLFKS